MFVCSLASKRLRVRFLGGLLRSLRSFLLLILSAVTSASATASSTSVCGLWPGISSLATLGHLIFDREIVSEIDAFFVHYFGRLHLLFLLIFAVVVEAEAEKAVGVDLAQVLLLVNQV